MYYRKKYRNPFRARIFACVGITWLILMPTAEAQTAPAATRPAVKSLPGSDKFRTTNAAAEHCPGDTVVWSSFSKSKVFHLSASKYFGKTKHGAFVCEKDAVAAGYHASKR